MTDEKSVITIEGSGDMSVGIQPMRMMLDVKQDFSMDEHKLSSKFSEAVIWRQLGVEFDMVHPITVCREIEGKKCECVGFLSQKQETPMNMPDSPFEDALGGCSPRRKT